MISPLHKIFGQSWVVNLRSALSNEMKAKKITDSIKLQGNIAFSIMWIQKSPVRVYLKRLIMQGFVVRKY